MKKILFRVYKDSINQGYWFDYGGIRQKDPPPAPMKETEEFVKDYNFVSCTDDPKQSMLYFPREFMERVNGLFGVLEVDEEYIKVIDSPHDELRAHLAFDYRFCKVIGRYTFDEFEKLTEEGAWK
jgi:hypothetical protein